MTKDPHNVLKQFELDTNTMFTKTYTGDVDHNGNKKVKLEISLPYLDGMIRGIWRKYDENNDGSLQRQEFREFFEDLFESAGMKGTKIDTDQLEDIFVRVDITQDGNISRMEMQKFLHKLFTEACKKGLDVERE